MLLRLARVLPALLAVGAALPAHAGSVNLFGLDADWKVTLGYAIAARTRNASQALINDAVDVQQVTLDPSPGACGTPPCIGSFGHTGLPNSTNFDDGNRDFKKGALLNNRLSAYGEGIIKFDSLGLGDLGIVGSGAAHYDQVFHDTNDHTNPDSVNRMSLVQITSANGSKVNGYNRVGPVNEWQQAAVDTNGTRYRLLEAYAYGQWYLTDTIGVSLRAGKHLAAWGESLFFPGIASAQGPFDATKANVPGVEVKEILLPVNQISLQAALTSEMTLLAYKQFEFKPTEIFPEGDFFSPADLVGPASSFGYGSINPLHDRWCGDTSRVRVTNDPTGSGQGLCQAGAAFTNEPEYIYTVRTPDSLPGTKDQWGVGLKYAITPDFNLGGYYLHYNNHNPNVQLNMGYAYVGDVSGQPIDTSAFNVRVPVSYTVDYADSIRMEAISFSTVFWVFNVGGELVHRQNVDTSLEATIAGVVAPVGTRGDTTTAQVSLLYVNNPDFLMYDEVVFVGEFGYTQVDKTEARKNEDGICFSGSDQADCVPGKSGANAYTSSGNVLFYDKNAAAMQLLVMPKGRNVFPGWDIGTPINFAWLAYHTPSTPGLFGALYGEGDMRVGVGVTAQYVQNMEFSLSYNAFLGSTSKTIGNSTLKANPYADHDYASFSVKYNL